MASPPSLPSTSGFRLSIRTYRPEDQSAVTRIFSDGMMGLLPLSVEEVVRGSSGLQGAIVGVPLFFSAALMASSRGRGWGSAAGAAVAAVASAAIMPLAILLHNRRLFKAYVKQSLETDLNSIDLFYSGAGAGQGSMFWVAELVEPGLKASPSQPALFRSASSAAFRNGEVQMQPVPLPAPAAAAPAQQPSPRLATAPPAPASEHQPVPGPGAVPATDAGPREPPVAPAETAGPSDEDDAEIVAGLVARTVARIEAAAMEAELASSGSRDLSTAGSRDLGASEAAAPSASAPLPPVADRAAPASTPSAAPPAAPDPTNALAAAPPAAAPKTPSVIVGHVALERKSWQVAELRRMSVAAGHRGAGIGRKLLETLVQHARNNGFRELILHTSSLQIPARKLYESAGWEVTKVSSEHGITFYSYKLDLTKKR